MKKEKKPNNLYKPNSASGNQIERERERYVNSILKEKSRENLTW